MPIFDHDLQQAVVDRLAMPRDARRCSRSRSPNRPRAMAVGDRGSCEDRRSPWSRRRRSARRNNGCRGIRRPHVDAMAKERRPLRTRCVCTPPPRGSWPSPTRSGTCSSVRNSWSCPRAPPFRPRRGSAAMAVAQRVRASPRAERCSRSRPPAPRSAARAAPSRVREHRGIEHQHVDWLASLSRMLARLPKRVFSDITCVSRKLSIGGFVTWLKFWRKKWLMSRGLSEMTASGVSSPIDPTASLASSTIGAEDQFHVLQRVPGGDLAAAQFGAVEASAHRPASARQIVDPAEILDPAMGASPAMRSLIARSS
jgi:hypothetical protein